MIVSVLSQRSLTIDHPFSVDITTTTPFKYTKESEILEAKAKQSLQQQNGTVTNEAQLQDEVSRQLQKKLRQNRPVLKYREKTGMWGYKTVIESVPKNTTAEELLDMRSKRQGRDKYC